MEITLKRDQKGHWWLREGKEDKEIRISTIAEAKKSLKKSRRQIYRYIEDGTLVSLGKPFGDHLLDHDSVLRLTDRPLKKHPIPKKVMRLFPEYDAKQINLGRDRTMVVGRVLEHGNLDDVRWLFRRLSQKELVSTLKEDGDRVLSKKACRFWNLLFGIQGTKEKKRRGSPWDHRLGKADGNS